ncbi:hypothetical protein EN933_02285 [Mesorhizobium sp. M7A.F.Ca.US.001.01.1.1]|nr:hypothetical protein EN933_02285 [Mesorhizobium sp. M7A.F.Ca.US.001.01.1.1]
MTTAEDTEESAVTVRQPKDARTDEIDWQTVDHEELKERALVYSYDLIEAKTRLIDVEPWVAVITAHIYVDHVLTNLLAENLKQPNAMLGEQRRKYVLEKLEICEAMDWINPEVTPVIRKLNSIRNGLAHNLVFELSKQTTLDLINCLPKVARDLVAENHTPTEGQPLASLGHHLQTLLIFLDMNRQQVLLHNYITRLRDRDLKKAMMNARDVLRSIQGGS